LLTLDNALHYPTGLNPLWLCFAIAFIKKNLRWFPHFYFRKHLATCMSKKNTAYDHQYFPKVMGKHLVPSSIAGVCDRNLKGISLTQDHLVTTMNSKHLKK
jgi:hypothetical protein